MQIAKSVFDCIKSGQVILLGLIALAARVDSQTIPPCGRYAPGSPEWELLRKPYNMGIAPEEFQSPTVIWLLCDYQDAIQSALKEAIQLNAAISVRAGGHHVEGYSSYAPAGSAKARVLIDVYHLKMLAFDPSSLSVSIGAGVKVTEANEFMAKQNPVVSLPFTECGTVGVAGSALGGGYGWLSRKQGLAADNIVSMNVAIIRNGKPEIVVVSATSEPNLFWALRGAGGGNFGVVLLLTFRAHPVPAVVTIIKGETTVPHAREVAQFIVNAPPDLFYSITINNGSEALTIEGIYMGVLPPAMNISLRALGFNDIQTYTPAQSRDWGRSMNLCEGEAGCLKSAANVPYFEKRYFKRKALFLHSIDEVVKVMDLMKGEKEISFLDFTPFNAQIGALQPTDTSFVHRDVIKQLMQFAALFLLMIFKFWKDNTGIPIATLNAGAKRFHDKVRALTSRQTGYPNFIDRDHLGEDWMRIFYGQNADRLRQIKQQYDPMNYFSFPMSIPLTAVPPPPPPPPPPVAPQVQPLQTPVVNPQTQLAQQPQAGKQPVVLGNHRGRRSQTQLGSQQQRFAQLHFVNSQRAIKDQAKQAIRESGGSIIFDNDFMLRGMISDAVIKRFQAGCVWCEKNFQARACICSVAKPGAANPGAPLTPVPALTPAAPVNCEVWKDAAYVQKFGEQVLNHMNCYRDLHKLTNRVVMATDWQRNPDAGAAIASAQSVFAAEEQPSPATLAALPDARLNTVFITDRHWKAEELVDHLYKISTDRQLFSSPPVAGAPPVTTNDRIWQLIVNPALTAIGVGVVCSPKTSRLYIAIHYTIPPASLDPPSEQRVAMAAKKAHLLQRLSFANVDVCDIKM